MAGYTFDESGQYNFFLVTILLLVLVPASYFQFRPDQGAASRVKPPCDSWLVKNETVEKVRQSRSRGLKTSHILLSLGWLVLSVATYQAAQVKMNSILYDPFKILGISSSLAERDIKKHFRRLTLKFHPDKLKLAENQTKEEVDAHFVELTKAYKSLTDETIRRNYELYGHPDGKQEMAMGIAIPSSFIASQNNIYILGAYALLFGVLLPYGVGRWWFGSRKYTKDRILNTTAATFYLNAKEDMRLANAIEIVSAAEEFADASSKASTFKSSEFDRLQNLVRDRILKLTGDKIEGQLYRQTAARKTAILIYAHLLRIQINDMALLTEQQQTITKAIKLTGALANIVLSHSWLTSYSVVVSLRQGLVQGVHPALPQVLALPHVSTTAALESKHKTIESFVTASDEDRKVLLKNMSDLEARQTLEVAQQWPKLELVSAAFKVTGERIVTPGSIIQLVVRVKISPSSRPTSQPNGHLSNELTVQEGGSGAVTPQEAIQGDEQGFDELIGRKQAGAEGEEAAPFAYAPMYAERKQEAWWMYLGDQKVDRIFFQPAKFSDIGHSGRIRTLRISQQAPANPGMYSFQLYVASDSYIGCDVRKDMKLTVEPLTALETSERNKEDEISDPEEDSLAGQMAAMRGQGVKRIPDEYDDDDESSSGTDEDVDEGGTTSESDTENK